MHFTNVITLALASLVVATPIDLEKMSLDDRTVCPTSYNRETILDGNGNPHQNFVFKQVSGTTDCTGNPSGGASVTETLTVGWSVSGGFTSDFITGGFSVSESQSTGYTNTFGCKTNTGTHTGSLCVFERIQLTAFTAQSRECWQNACSGGGCGAWSNGVIFAPNSAQGSCFYDNFQLGLPCNGLGAEHYVYSGPAGGPQYIGCQPTHA